MKDEEKKEKKDRKKFSSLCARSFSLCDVSTLFAYAEREKGSRFCLPECSLLFFRSFLFLSRCCCFRFLRYMTQTKEWKDGAIAVIMRNMSKERGRFKPSHLHKWIVLDGDIDAEWIESMNTVMDDNKVKKIRTPRETRVSSSYSSHDPAATDPHRFVDRHRVGKTEK